MEILYLLIPISLAIVVLAIGVFFWAVKSGQYDDLEGPAWRILFDDEDPAQRNKSGSEHPQDTPPGGT
ncbi:MAG: cbb3-type cytochrome oxidase assembly protein CcoS [Gammaproteobacteria bacterium]|jgi:cbb3-type cytochrome oxidase maturation protein|nr:cbb3-type cytochrome oxidase assembly protein CcoS [Gammaproteobacteria bacterium]